MDITRCLHHLFKEQVQLTPSKSAVVGYNGRSLSFQELDYKTHLLAQYLQQLGCKTDTPIGIYMERCLEYTTAYIAALKAGGCYLPIDFSYPIPLLCSVLEDAKPLAIITLLKYKKWLPSDIPATVICLDEGWEKNIRMDKQMQLIDNSSPDDLAYIVYSSGTTGAPKGIMCPHRGAVYSYTARHQNYPFKQDERVACNIFFVWEMLRPLLKGVTMFVIPDDIIYDPPKLIKFLHDNKITRILLTPSLLEAVVNDEALMRDTSFEYLKYVWLCGEVVTVSLQKRFIEIFPDIKLINLYSISECHDVSVCDLSNDMYNKDKPNLKTVRKFCPVGKVLDEVKVVILDDYLKPLPIGMKGEIYVGGPTLARGYVNRPDLDKNKFIDTPKHLVPKYGNRLYCTGDWGYLLSSGELEICGRCDSMVKIRGFSIELQAVESQLLGLRYVKACKVLAQGEEGDDKYLVAYIVPIQQVTKKEIRSALKAKLPGYMIPSYFVLLKSVPIAPSGKLDAKTLPKFSKNQADIDSDDGKPNTNTESFLHISWKTILNLTMVDTQENFFDIGGHSLLAARLISMIREKYSSIEITMAEFFQNNTIVELGNLIDFKLGTITRRSSSNITDTDLSHEIEYYDQNYVNMDFMLRAFWNSCQYSHRWSNGRVLLTGATGFLGAYLLRELLLTTKVHIYCLVRESSDQQPCKRLSESLAKYGILNKTPSEECKINVDSNVADNDTDKVDSEFQLRVTVLKGDISLTNFGLTEDDYAYFSYEIDFIIHAAAVVNLVYPYKTLHGVNVVGTQNILFFAGSSKIKPVHYISTDAVFPPNITNCNEDTDLTNAHKDLQYGYAQSKWVAEQLVLKARDRGLPAAIYRLGNLSGDSVNANWNKADFNLMFLLSCINSGIAPMFNFKFEMTPVDFASYIIVSLTQQISWSLGKTIHIINKKTIDSKHMFEWISANGYPLSILLYDDWLQRMEKLEKTGKSENITKVTSIMTSMNSSVFEDTRVFTHDNLSKYLEIYLKDKYIHITSSILRKYLSGLVKQQLISRPKMSNEVLRPLSNRVALVTGASSGIGEAIAKKLAESGASLVIAARRIEKLEKIRNDLLREGNIVAAMQADVTKLDDMKKLVEETSEMFGNIDILVNSAGVMYYTMMKNFQVDQWEKQVDVNCKGTMNAVAAVLPGMLQQENGHIINISSDAGRKVFPGLTVYSATKAFVESFSQGLRLETANSGIKVTTIQPGDVKTALFELTTDKEAESLYAQPNKEIVLQPEDIANAVLYAVTQPRNCSVNEILIEPREAPI